MMSFLEQVSKDIIQKFGHNLSRVAVVFPNKRASIFMNEHLARYSDKPVWSPTYLTISELFRNHSSYIVPDQLKLICDLHKCFVDCTGIDESLDHFFGWGQLMLADFEDVDKHMADAAKVFANVKDLHAYDDVSYLTDEQKNILKKFFSNFSDTKNSELKQRFLKIWSRFLDIYLRFNEVLKDNGLAYEGALYREVACNETIEFEYDHYIFVGFNMLQEVEKKLFSRLMHEGKAHFYWDFDKYYLDKPYQHEAGLFIKHNIKEFPCSLDTDSSDIYNNFTKKKTLRFVAATTEDMQARYVNDWLLEDGKLNNGRKTAIVMCNEGLMQTILHSLPNGCPPINITTGYPLQQTPVASFIKALMSLRCDGYNYKRNRYMLSYINRILNHPYTSYLSDNTGELYNEINVYSKSYYPTEQQLFKDDNLALLFSNPVNGGNEGITKEMALIEWLQNIIKLLADNAKDIDDQLFQESIFRAYTLLNRLSSLMQSGDLCVNIATLQSLVNQLIQSTSIPFHGEPAVGIQIMGVLETRNLDFDNLLILSCNEGNMPKGINDNSFIPYSIRKAFGLTTIDNKVAIYAYYFYRLLQRARHITIVYSNATDEGNKSEMSRFMMQLLVESGHHIEHKVFTVNQEPRQLAKNAISKSDDIVRKLIARFSNDENNSGRPLLTPTAINQYLHCPLLFYYKYVCGIKEPDFNDEDTIDGRIFGLIFHAASQTLYNNLKNNDGWIRREYIKQLLKSDIAIEKAVDDAFKKELFNITSNYKPDYNGHQLINREVIIIYLRRLLKNDMNLGAFKIIGLESYVKEHFEISTPNLHFTTTLGGIIDRLDMISTPDGLRIRVIDYKTGRYSQSKIPSVDELFVEKKTDNHSNYFIQTFIYSMIVRDSCKLNPSGLPVSPALLFIQHSAEESDDIVLQIGGNKIFDIKHIQEDFMRLLEQKINEIFDTDIPFTPTDNTQKCKHCPFASLCTI